MNSTQIRNLLWESSLVPFTAGRIEQTAIALRNSNLLPKGGHGLNAPHLPALYIARLILGLCAPVVSYAPEQVRLWATLPSSLRAGHTFEDSLTQLLMAPENDQRVTEVVVSTDWPFARISFERRQSNIFEIPDAALQRNGFKRSAMSRQVTFAGGFFQQLAKGLDKDPDNFEWRTEA